MNENLKKQLQKLWCEDETVKPLYKPDCSCVNFYNHGDVVTCNCDVQQSIEKLTESGLDTSSYMCPTNDRPECDEGLKCE